MAPSLLLAIVKRDISYPRLSPFLFCYNKIIMGNLLLLSVAMAL
jgi:hypothetical protein